jgi:tetratricopeptide (TPR) repeat protein
MKALEKDRGRRYETANGFAADVQRYLAGEAVQAVPPSAAYRLRKFARRNKAGLAVAALVLSFVVLLGGGVGWAVRDRSARQEETARQAGESLARARRWVGENKLALARQDLAEAKGRIGTDRAALHGLAEEIEALEAELDKYQEFLALIDQARDAEFRRPEVVAPPDHGKTPASSPPPSDVNDPAKAVPFLLRALSHYQVLERDDWLAGLESRPLGPGQVAQVRRAAYEELLWLAHDVVWRRQDHRSGGDLPPQEAARAGLAYLAKAEAAFRPTTAFYQIRARCREAMGAVDAARADEATARHTPAAIALDRYLPGTAAARARRHAEAVGHFEAALRVEPAHYWSLFALGNSLTDLGQEHHLTAAAGAFTGCILKRPDHGAAYASRGRCYIGLKRYEDAIADCGRAIELQPDHEAAWDYRHQAFQGQRDRALAEYDRAIARRPDHHIAWYHRARTHIGLKRFDLALADYAKAIELRPDHPRAWLSRGTLYEVHLRRNDEAVADYSKVIELDPDGLWGRWAYLRRGALYWAMEQWDNAGADLSKQVERSPGDWIHRNKLAWLLATCPDPKLRDPARAVEHARRAVELAPESGTVRNTLGVAHYRAGDWAAAVAALEKSVELRKGGDGFDWFFLAMAYRRLGDEAEARKWYDKAAAWMGKNKTDDEELRRFRAEAAGVLGVGGGDRVEVAPPPREKK